MKIKTKAALELEKALERLGVKPGEKPKKKKIKKGKEK
jgi:hypothetical protein